MARPVKHVKVLFIYSASTKWGYYLSAEYKKKEEIEAQQ